MTAAEMLIKEEAKRERERQRLYEAQIVENCVLALKLSSITYFQIEEWLRCKGITRETTIERLAHNVRVSYSH